LARYGVGAKTIKNFIVHSHGGVTNRPGMDFVGATKDHSKRSRLIPFAFSTVQTYALEFGDLYMRVIKDDGYVLEPSVVITGATQANPVVISAAGHGYSNGDEVFIDDIVGMTELNGFRFIAANVAAGTFELTGIDGTGYTAYVSGGTVARIFTLVTTYLEADLPLLKYTQSADVMTLVHPSYVSRDLTRTDHYVWTITDITFAPSVAAPTGESATGSGTSNYKVTAIEEETLEESLPTAAIDGGALPCTITWTDPGGIERWNIYKEDNGLYGFIGSTETNSFVEPAAGITADTSLNPPSARNPFSGADDYPGAVAYFEQRKCFAGTNNDPQKEWMTQVGNFVNMGKHIPLRDDDAFDFTLNSLKVNQIKHLVPMEELLALTSGSEWKTGSGDQGFTLPNSRTRQQGAIGCSDVTPVVIGDTVLFVQEKGNSVRDLGYEVGSNTYRGIDLTQWANHLFRGFEIKEMAFALVPFSVVWCVRDDGKMVALTYLKDQEVWAWHQHETDGLYESVCSISEGQEDAVYVIINRTIEGNTRRYVEKMHTRYFDTIEDAFFVDSGLTYDVPVVVSGATQADPVVVTATGHGFSNGQEVRFTHIKGMTELNQHYYKAANVTANTFELQNTDSVDIDGTGFGAYVSGGEVRKTITTVTGLDHLEGKSLSILADGSVQPARTVVDGSITLQRAASEIHAGLGYISDIETLDILLNVDGAGQAKQKKIDAISLKVEQSRGFFAGNSEETLTEYKQRTDEDYGVPTRMETGIQRMIMDSSWTTAGRVFIRQIDPLPLTILAITPSVTPGG
jgi:hypothetical protein